MKYCLPFTSELKYAKQCEELSIFYNRSDTSIVDFVKKYQEKRIIVRIDEILDIESRDLNRLRYIYENYGNIVIKLSKKNVEIVDRIKNLEIPFFYREFPADTDQIIGMIEDGVSDIYIGNELGFDIKRISNIIRSINPDIKIRVFPNIAQSSWENKNENREIVKFFIRPEDTKIYEKYIDVFEAWNPKTANFMYKIYAINQCWNGSIDEIIDNCNIKRKNNTFLPCFAETRASCAKRCQKKYTCHVCYSMIKLAESIENKNMYIHY